MYTPRAPANTTPHKVRPRSSSSTRSRPRDKHEHIPLTPRNDVNRSFINATRTKDMEMTPEKKSVRASLNENASKKDGNTAVSEAVYIVHK